MNERIRRHLGRDARNLQVGHAYLLEGGKPVTDLSRFVQIVSEDIVPLLEEYCYEDYSVLSEILGKLMVDNLNQRVRHELFAPENRENFVQALLASTPHIEAVSNGVLSPPTLDYSEELKLDGLEQ